MNYRDPRRRAALAAEYALGTLRGPAKRRFERLLHDDFTLREEVQRWENDLYPPLLEALPEQPPPERVWKTVNRQIRPDAVSRAKTKRSASGGLWQSIGFWRGWAALASAALLVLVLYQPLEQPDLARKQPTHVAVLTDSANRPAWLVQVNDERTRLRVQTLHAQQREADRSFELWLLPDGERGPVSLGLLPAGGAAELALRPSARQLLSSATGMAVSLEPAGGSPEAGPTGPVLYQGPLAAAVPSDAS